jgi:carboxymethylenebutenolidase
MKTETMNFNTANGASSAFVAKPEEPTERAVILIQEWWGLNEHIKEIAKRYADAGFIAIAPDLYRGVATKDPQEASRLMHGLEIEDGLNTIESAMEKSREAFKVKSFGITGFCMGGTFALRAACELAGLKAAAPFYGDIPEEDILQKLKIPVTFVSGTRDSWINPEKVSALEDAAKKFNLPVKSLKYDADHAFFNNTRPEVYDEAAAKDAWEKVIAFFEEKL